eukprot:Gb_31290 [translate_table: standard]
MGKFWRNHNHVHRLPPISIQTIYISSGFNQQLHNFNCKDRPTSSSTMKSCAHI